MGDFQRLENGRFSKVRKWEIFKGRKMGDFQRLENRIFSDVEKWEILRG